MVNFLKVRVFILLGFVFSNVFYFSQEIQEIGDGSKKFVKVEEISAFDFLLKGGVFLIPIVILLFYTIFLGVEKFIYINKKGKLKKGFLDNVNEKINKGEISNAVSIVNNETSSFGQMIHEGIENLGKPIAEIESNMEKVTNIEISKMERKLSHLGLIAGIAPTLGFIGTISGVIKIFYNISISENVSIGNISGGLYEKMISSGAGLVVGIIAFSFYHILNSKIDSFVLNAQEMSLRFINFIKKPSNGDKTK